MKVYQKVWIPDTSRGKPEKDEDFIMRGPPMVAKEEYDACAEERIDLRARVKALEAWAGRAIFALHEAYNDTPGWCDTYKAVVREYPTPPVETKGECAHDWRHEFGHLVCVKCALCKPDDRKEDCHTPPYPWCRQPSVCRGTCPLDPSCGE